MSSSIALRVSITTAIIMSAAALAILAGIIYKIDTIGNSLDRLDTEISQAESVIKKEVTNPLEVGAPDVNKNEFYIFTQELNANEEKVGIPVAVYSLAQIIVHRGDKITIHFINAAEEPEDRHTFTMQAPYKMNYDLAGGESTKFSFTADTVGTFTYYCTYDLPSMVGQLIVLP